MNKAVSDDAIWFSLPMPGFILDAEDRIESINPAAEQFANASAKALRGFPIWDKLAVDAPLDDAFARVRSNHAELYINDVDVSTGNDVPELCTITPFETFHAEDGLFVIAAGNDALFKRLCDALDLPYLPGDPRFASNAARCDNARLLKRLIEAVTLGNPKSYWIDRLEKAGVPTGPIQDVAEAMQDPQLIARNMVATVAAPPGGARFSAAGNPIKMSDLPDSDQRPPAPLLDGDREAILNWLKSREGNA